MSNPNLNNLTSEQERVLSDAFRFIRQRAAWIRTQKKAASESIGSKTHVPATANTSKPTLAHRQGNCNPTVKQS